MKNNLRFQNGRLSVIILAVIVAAFATLSGVIFAQGLPDNPPDGERGSQIFAERCAVCHGFTGEGDGEMADRLDVPPQAFTDPDYRKTAVSSTMFNMITDGDSVAGMPPFGTDNETNPITEQDRWNLVGAVYSLATPPDAIESGTAVYEASCLECHGEAGDGVENADLTDYSYWVERSNEDVFDAIENEAIADHDYALSDDERWDAVDYIRTFSYGYYDPIAAALPIEEGSVYGNITNGTTDEIVSGMTVRVRAFDSNFEEMLEITTTVEADGSYQVTLTDVDPSWVYMSGTEYGDLPFAGPAGQLTHALPSFESPITVYDSTTSADDIHVGQQHSIIAFGSADRLNVDEIYTVVNDGTAVFIGEDGDLDSGAVHYMVPVGAENVDFARSYSAMQQSIPAMDDMVQISETEWADTLPLRPGTAQSNLVVRYEMPYDGGADLSRTLPYLTEHINLILPDNGVELAADMWTFIDSTDMGEMGQFITYELLDVPAETAVEIVIEGEPAAPTNGGMGSSDGITTPAADSNAVSNPVMLVIGGVVLLMVVGSAAFIITSRRKTDDHEDEYEELDEENAGDTIEANTLIARLATLDTAYEAGEIEEDAYQEQRTALKDKLKAIW